jgi:hypothetical protein
VSTARLSDDPRSFLPAAIQSATADDLDVALGGILSAATTGLGAQAGAIVLADPDRTDVQVAAAMGFAVDELAGFLAGPHRPPPTRRSSRRWPRLPRSRPSGRVTHRTRRSAPSGSSGWPIPTR